MKPGLEVPSPSASPELGASLSRLFASDPAVMDDPTPLWRRLRAEAPIYFHGNAYLVSTGEGVRQLISDQRATANIWGVGNRAKAARAALPSDGKLAFDEITAFEALYMSRTDGQAHDRLRRIAQRTFTPRRIVQIQQVIETTTNECLTALAAQTDADFMSFAYRLPLRIIGDLLAIPEDDLEKVHGWSSKLGRNRGGTEYGPLMEAHAALLSFRAYVEDMICRLRSRPRDGGEVSLVGDLLGANDGDNLSDIELTAMFVVLLFAGHETTTNLIGTGLMSLLRADQWSVLCGRPALVPQAVNELVRYVSPVQWLGRNIAEPLEIYGQKLEAGETVLLMIAAANRDPALFEQPDVLDIERKDNANHFGFGRGSHLCLGANLARMEAISVFSTLARRFPSIGLVTEDLTWTGNAALRSLAALPVNLGLERSC